MASLLLYEFFNDVSQSWDRDWIIAQDIAEAVQVINSKVPPIRNLRFFEGEYIDVGTYIGVSETKPKRKVK